MFRQTPEQEREFQRDQDHINRLQMTSPSVRRERDWELAIPRQPNFGMMQQNMGVDGLELDHIQNAGLDYQLGAPFQLQDPVNTFMQGSSNWHMGFSPNHPQQRSQPLAGPSRLPDMGVYRPMRDFTAELEMNFRQQHANRVLNRNMQRSHSNSRPQHDLEDRTVNRVYERHSAQRQNNRVRNHIQQQQFDAAQQLQAQIAAAQNVAVQNGHVAAQQQIRANAALPPGRRIYSEPPQRQSVGQMNIQCTCCGALHFLEECLSCSTRRQNHFSSCCLQGQLLLPTPTLPP